NVIYFFFFSSRRRHTISKRDWSSDVCSSDLNRQHRSKLHHNHAFFLPRHQISFYRVLNNIHRPTPKRSILEHKAMVSCLKAQDGKAARNVMQSHRKRAYKEIIKALEVINQEK